MSFELNGVLNGTLKVFLSVVTLLLALAIGLQIRRILVTTLRKTIFDAWLIQTLGFLTILPLLLLAAPIVLAILRIEVLSEIVSNVLGVNTNNTLSQRLIDFGINLLISLIILALGIGIARTLKLLTMRGLETNHVDINIRTFMGRVFYIIALVITVFSILAVWKIELVIPAAILGAIAVALTVSIQDILKDLVAGLYLLVERPFFIGNLIRVTVGMDTFVGRVVDVQLRATRLRLISGEEVAIPNTNIFTGTVVNTSFYGERRATFDVMIPKDLFDREETPTRILHALGEMKECVLDKPEPTIFFSNYTEDTFTLSTRFWIATEQPKTVSDVMYTLHTLLPEASLSVKEVAGNV